MFAVLDGFANRKDPEFYLKPIRVDILQRLREHLPALVESIDKDSNGTDLDKRIDELLSKSVASGVGKPGENPRAAVDAYLAANPDPENMSFTDKPELGRLVSNYDFLTGLARLERPAVTGEAIAAEFRKRFGQEAPDCMATVFGPPPVRGVGRAGGFKIMIENRGSDASIGSLQDLQKATDDVVAEAAKEPLLEQPADGPKAAEQPSFFSKVSANIEQAKAKANDMLDRMIKGKKDREKEKKDAGPPNSKKPLPPCSSGFFPYSAPTFRSSTPTSTGSR